MKWKHPEAIMRMRIQGQTPTCWVCAHSMLLTGVGANHCSAGHADPAPNASNWKDPRCVCPDFLDKPE